MSLLAVIPARGGSKGLPGKNIAELGGRPLIAWTIAAAKSAVAVTRVIVSTDDQAIADAAASAGADVPFLRPASLSTDTASSVDVMAHALRQSPGYPQAVLLQPTSPFRTGADIDAAHALMNRFAAPSCVSVTTVTESPYLMFEAMNDGRLSRLLPEPMSGLRRQDLPHVVRLNGAMYFVRPEQFLADRCFLHADSVGYEIPAERAMDIDDAEDLDHARGLCESMSIDVMNEGRQFGTSKSVAKDRD